MNNQNSSPNGKGIVHAWASKMSRLILAALIALQFLSGSAEAQRRVTDGEGALVKADELFEKQEWIPAIKAYNITCGTSHRGYNIPKSGSRWARHSLLHN